MKRKEFLADIADVSADDLRKKAISLSEELMKLRFRKASGQLDQTHRIRETSRNFARVKTRIEQLRGQPE